VTSAADVARADAYGSDYVLLDGAVAGSGATFDWTLARELAKKRKLTLAGGLTPENVADAIRAVSPYCVDVASGVEREPRRKERALVREFVRRAQPNR
jgi:phosphoribosylanthranilate isomerase